jgi:hypothetical protein
VANFRLLKWELNTYRTSSSELKEARSSFGNLHMLAMTKTNIYVAAVLLREYTKWMIAAIIGKERDLHQ